MWNNTLKIILFIITGCFAVSCELIQQPEIAIASFELQSAPEDAEISSITLTLTHSSGDTQTKVLDTSSRYVELQLDQGKYFIELSAITTTGEYKGRDEIVLTAGKIEKVNLDLSFIESPLISIDISPKAVTIPAGTNQQFRAEGTYENERKEDITNSVSWSVSELSKASIDKEGFVKALKTGSIVIAASLKGIRSTVKLEVSSAVLQTISISPVDVTVKKGNYQQFTAEGTYSDNSTQDITSNVSWSSSNTDIVNIDSDGIANAIKKGAVTVTARSGNISDTTSVIVETLQFDTGQHFVMVIKEDGTLWGWGRNQSGQIGDGTTTNRTNPKQIGTDKNWHRIVAAKLHTLAIKTDGSLWAWGSNAYGQLGNGTTTNQKTPMQIGIDTDWKFIGKSGGDHSLAIKTDGTLWVWGNNAYGQLGNGTTSNQKTPMQIGIHTDWKFVTGGHAHTLAIKNNGTLWTWGSNVFGQLGDGTQTNRYSPVQIQSNLKWENVSGGTHFSLGVASEGSLWTWGRNNFGQLGQGTSSDLSEPTRVSTGTNWKLAAAGNVHAFAITTNAELWGWGRNKIGQVGLGWTSSKVTTPQKHNATGWNDVEVGTGHTIAVLNEENLKGWGWNDYGQLGIGHKSNKKSPQAIQF